MKGDTFQIIFLLRKCHSSKYGHFNKIPQNPALRMNRDPLVIFANSASGESLLSQWKFPADPLLENRRFMDIVNYQHTWKWMLITFFQNCRSPLSMYFLICFFCSGLFWNMVRINPHKQHTICLNCKLDTVQWEPVNCLRLISDYPKMLLWEEITFWERSNFLPTQNFEFKTLDQFLHYWKCLSGVFFVY